MSLTNTMMFHDSMFVSAEERTIISKFISYIISSSQSIVARQSREEEERNQIDSLLDEAINDLSLVEGHFVDQHKPAKEEKDKTLEMIPQTPETEEKEIDPASSSVEKLSESQIVPDVDEASSEVTEERNEYIHAYVQGIIQEASAKVLGDTEDFPSKILSPDSSLMESLSSPDSEKPQHDENSNKKQHEYDQLLKTLVRERSIQKALEYEGEYENDANGISTVTEGDDLTNQKYFVAVNCNTKQKKHKGPLQRFGKSLRNFFACTSVRSADVT